MAINKVKYGETVLIDLTDTTATADKVVAGYIFHDNSGAIVTGTLEFVDGDNLGYGLRSSSRVDIGAIDQMVVGDGSTSYIPTRVPAVVS